MVAPKKRFLTPFMFTGIIQEQGIVRSIQRSAQGVRLIIAHPRSWKRLALGESIAIDGVCLTLSSISQHLLNFDVMAQTLPLTSLGRLTMGSHVNLERPVHASDRLGGHIVSGHVDAVGTVTKAWSKPNDYQLSVRLPRALKKYCPVRGSVSLNGVSLTIAGSSTNTITVALVDYTLKHTNLGLLKKGDSVNIEVDLIARYLEQLSRG